MGGMSQGAETWVGEVPGDPDPRTSKVFISPVLVNECWDASWEDEQGHHRSYSGTLEQVTAWALSKPAAARYMTDGEDEFRVDPDGSLTKIS